MTPPEKTAPVLVVHCTGSLWTCPTDGAYEVYHEMTIDDDSFGETVHDELVAAGLDEVGLHADDPNELKCAVMLCVWVGPVETKEAT